MGTVNTRELNQLILLRFLQEYILKSNKISFQFIKQDRIISGDQVGNLVEKQLSEDIQGCLEGYYFNINSCLKCNDKCKTCSKSSTNCVSCYDQQFRRRKISGPLYICSCIDNYYESNDNSPVCIGCHQSCLTCSDNNNQLACLSCNTQDTQQGNRELIQVSAYLNQNQCQCKQGYFQDPSDLLCKKCHYSCKTCINSEQCTECPLNSISNRKNLSNGKCECSEGYFDDGSNPNCIKCLKQCRSCLNQNTCLLCSTPELYDRIDIEKDTKCGCKDGFFDNGVSLKCELCQGNCLKCKSNTQCLECDPKQNRILDINTSKCECSEGFYDKEGKQAVCIQCPHYCKTCNNNGQCKQCNDQMDYHRKNYSLSNNCECEDGYFDDGTNQQCQKCDGTCQTCTQKGQCVSCIQNALNHRSGQLDENGQCKCNDGYFLDQINNTCIKCPYYCKTCNNDKDCKTCESNPIYNRENMINNNQQCTCLDGFYDDGKNLNCQKCPYNCKTCDQNRCTSCNIDFNRKNISDSETCECKEGFYDKSNQAICEQCPNNCLMCDQQGSCTSCDTSDLIMRKEFKISSTCECQEGFFDDKTNKPCQKCDESCATCSSFQQCTSCNQLKNRQLDLKINQCKCIDGFYEDKSDFQCKKCHSYCKSCFGQNDNQCTECFLEDNRILNNSQCTCNEYTVDKGIQKCQYKIIQTSQCHFSCLKCNGNQRNQCKECKTKNISFRQFNNQVNTCDCVDGYYEIQGNPICGKCHKSCYSCFNDTSQGCLSCDQSKFRIFDEINNQCKCMNGYFLNNLNGQCQKCHDFCQECHGSNIDQCLSCDLDNQNRILKGNQCICQNNYTEIRNTCIKQKISECDISCKLCDYIEKKKCYECNEGFQFDEISKQCSCQKGSFQQYNICSKCDSNCLTCEQRSGKCTSCRNKLFLNDHYTCIEIFPTKIANQTIQAVYNVTESSTYVSLGASAGGSVLLSIFSPNGNLVQQFLSVQKLNFILLVEIALPELLYMFFKAVGGSSPLTILQNINLLNNQIIHDSRGEQIGGKFKSEQIASSIFVNAGGIITIIIITFIIFIPSVILYKNNTLIVSKLHDYSIFAQRSKKIYENIVSSALIQIHEIITLVVYFSTNTQIFAFIQFGCYVSFFSQRVIFTILLKAYFGFINIFTFKIINNKNFLQKTKMDSKSRSEKRLNQQDFIDKYSTKKNFSNWIEVIFIHLKSDLIEQNWVTRNFKIFYSLIENIIIPSCIVFFHFSYSLQIGFCLFFQLILLLVSVKYRPYKQFINNFYLILDQFCWVSIYILILILGKRIKAIFSVSKDISDSDIEQIDKISWAIMIFCLVILFFNPIIMIIKLISFIPTLIQKVKNMIKEFKKWKNDIKEQKSYNKQDISFSSQILQYNEKQQNDSINLCSINFYKVQDKQRSNKLIGIYKQKTINASLITKYDLNYFSTNLQNLKQKSMKNSQKIQTSRQINNQYDDV